MAAAAMAGVAAGWGAVGLEVAGSGAADLEVAPTSRPSKCHNGESTR